MLLGLATPFLTDNFGTQLQAFALQSYLTEKGFENEIIKYRFRDKVRDPRKFFISERKTYKKDAERKSRLIRTDPAYRKGMRERREKFRDFKEKNLRFSVPCDTMKEVRAMADSVYSAVICGSDQIWLPSHVLRRYYLLEYLPDKVKRIAYAPSFGVSSVPWFLKPDYRRAFSKFSLLTSREKTGAEIVGKITGRECPVVCDPTLLLDRDDWDRLFSLRDREVGRKYVLGYFIGDSVENRQKAKEYAEKRGLSLILIPSGGMYSDLDEKYADMAPYDIGPVEFVDLIRNAEAVFTDSFHGSVFTLHYEKSLYCFERYPEASADSRNSRIYNLLEICGIRDRLIKGGKELPETEMDYADIKARLGALREESEKIFIGSLGQNG